MEYSVILKELFFLKSCFDPLGHKVVMRFCASIDGTGEERPRSSWKMTPIRPRNA